MKTHTQNKPTPTPTLHHEWKVHSYRLLKEIVDCSGIGIFEKPLSIFGKLLAAVGERAAEINDPQLNALMCRLTIYTVADPDSPDYNPELLEEISRLAKKPPVDRQAILLAVAEAFQAALNMSDSEHPDFVDSGADVCEYLHTHAAQVAEAIKLAKGTP